VGSKGSAAGVLAGEVAAAAARFAEILLPGVRLAGVAAAEAGTAEVESSATWLGGVGLARSCPAGARAALGFAGVK
jgi:hypothetical protein